MSEARRWLGLDPGLTATGWGIVAVDGPRLAYVAHGVVRTDPAEALAARLVRIQAAVGAAVAAHNVQAAAIELTFVNVNPQASLKLGHARAAAMLGAALAGLTVAEITPTEVKQALVGTGAAGKAQVAAMVARLLPGLGATRLASDASDALAIAIAAATRGQITARLAASR